MIEVTILHKGRPTRTVKLQGLYESAEDLLPALEAKVAGQDRGEGVTYEFCLVEDVAEHRANGGEYELVEPSHDSTPEVRAWALHTTRTITIRCADYDLLLKLYFMLLHWPEARLDTYRTKRGRLMIEAGANGQ
ncbi:MAG TPA: hypothetical protein VJM32_05505 [Candidatus Saccharimonadales bacterium]|nr:hypothetical protein [Candidatus Saccharimonadales bacterium]